MDLNTWLHDDLGLVHVNEEHLNGLIYHPRHGALLRRLLAQLKETTVSSKRHPGANVDNELHDEKERLNKELAQLEELKAQVRHIIADNQRVEHAVWKLRERLNYQQELNDLLNATNEILKRIESRPKTYKVLLKQSNIAESDVPDAPKSLCSVAEFSQEFSQDCPDMSVCNFKQLSAEVNAISDAISSLIMKHKNLETCSLIDDGFRLKREDFEALL